MPHRPPVLNASQWPWAGNQRMEPPSPARHTAQMRNISQWCFADCAPRPVPEPHPLQPRLARSASCTDLSRISSQPKPPAQLPDGAPPSRSSGRSPSVDGSRKSSNSALGSVHMAEPQRSQAAAPDMRSQLRRSASCTSIGRDRPYSAPQRPPRGHALWHEGHREADTQLMSRQMRPASACFDIHRPAAPQFSRQMPSEQGASQKSPVDSKAGPVLLGRVRPSSVGQACSGKVHTKDQPVASAWAGPPAPKRASNATLKRGTQAFPEGPMVFRGTTLGDVGQIAEKSDFVRTQPVPNRNLRRGTEALPNGPMSIHGTTMGEFGSMYTYKGISAE